MIQHEQALEWAKQYLISFKNADVLKHEKVVKASYSIVYKIETNQGCFYLKLVPEALFTETKLLSFMHQQGCANIPTILANNPDYLCFLMTSCGEISLRHHFNKKIDLAKLTLGISNYTKIQRTLENEIQPILLLGIPDWRLDKFVSLYYKLIQKEELLINDGLTKAEIDHLHQLYNTCVKLCDELSQHGIPETISHCDFHENNMLIEKKTGEINIIDWGETVISHPFFSLNGCLWNIVHFNELQETDLEYQQLQLHCI
ncbi:MAG: aminoglycoside phosphotransferase family protein, partial [Gammaproteobacteria bacterium]